MKNLRQFSVDTAFLCFTCYHALPMYVIESIKV